MGPEMKRIGKVVDNLNQTEGLCNGMFYNPLTKSWCKGKPGYDRDRAIPAIKDDLGFSVPRPRTGAQIP